MAKVLDYRVYFFAPPPPPPQVISILVLNSGGGGFNDNPVLTNILCSELDASVLARLPYRTNRDSRYFNDPFQVGITKNGTTF